MPIYLPPLSRRRFLGRSLVAALAAALPRSLWAGAKSVNQNSWALLSDPHLAADRGLVSRGVNMTDHFVSVAHELGALPEHPAGVFITGDCAYNSGQAGDYARLGDLLQPLRQEGMPVHLALGNHDNRERFWEAFPEEKHAQHPLADRQVGLLQTPHLNWFLLDSLEKTLSTPGLLGQEQLAWLERALDAHPDKPAVVLIHHNPGINGGNMGLKDTFALLGIIRPRQQVKAYIYGHTHNWKIEQDTSGIHLVNLPPVAYVFREGKPSGWVHATLTDSGMQLELRCLDPKHPDHGQKVRLDWRP